MGHSWGVDTGNPNNITDMPRFLPDGTGRDGYIARNNGGYLKEPAPLIHTRPKSFAAAASFARQPTTPVSKYYPCGDGRDCWRAETNETKYKDPRAFTKSFREYEPIKQR